jgi:hypothetical protein
MPRPRDLKTEHEREYAHHAEETREDPRSRSAALPKAEHAGTISCQSGFRNSRAFAERRGGSIVAVPVVEVGAVRVLVLEPFVAVTMAV